MKSAAQPRGDIPPDPPNPSGKPPTPSAATMRSFREQFPPSCPYGFTRDDLERYFGAKEGEPHPLWTQLRGQTQMICEGRLYNHDTREYTPSACAGTPHGTVAYVHDVQEWYEGRPVSDW